MTHERAMWIDPFGAVRRVRRWAGLPPRMAAPEQKLASQTSEAARSKRKIGSCFTG